MKCATKFCRNDRAPKRTICHKCQSRVYRANNPITALFHTVKSHAKSRGIPFLLTRPEFEAFCIETQYHVLKGRSGDSASIDRIRGDEPYHAGNIQMKTVSLNSIKSWFDGSRQSTGTDDADY